MAGKVAFKYLVPNSMLEQSLIGLALDKIERSGRVCSSDVSRSIG